MATQTRTGAYLNKMAQGGHFKQKLGEASLALTECVCKADHASERALGDSLVAEVQKILHEVYGWDFGAASNKAARLADAFADTTRRKQTGGEP